MQHSVSVILEGRMELVEMNELFRSQKVEASRASRTIKEWLQGTGGLHINISDILIIIPNPSVDHLHSTIDIISPMLLPHLGNNSNKCRFRLDSGFNK